MAEFDGDIRQGGFYDTTLKPAPKRIVICCDGTWQTSVTIKPNIPSNVTRLARYLTKIGRDDQKQEWQQVVYYDAGIGTGVSEGEAMLQGATGTGFVGNVIEAYNFVVLNYNPGDKIFCFGFSRGAYTARAVAGLITDIGIISPRHMQDFPALYNIYQSYTKSSHMFRKSKEWREWVEGVRLFDPTQKDLPMEWKQRPSAWVKPPHGAAPESSRWVEVVGVFDTVGSLGIPKSEGFLSGLKNAAAGLVKATTGDKLVEKFGFHNVTLSPYIKHAYHAMALDEHRKPFTPTLWHLPGDDIAKTPKPKGSSSHLRDTLDQLRDDDNATDAQRQVAWENLIDAEMYEELKGASSELLQVWFPGVHINIGGGSDDILLGKPMEGDFEQIAMLTLYWMVEQLRPHLSFEMSFTALASADRFFLARPAVEYLVQNKKTNWLTKKINTALTKDKNDPWQDNNKTRTMVLAADALKGWATGPIIDSYQGKMKEGGSLARTPGGYKDPALGPTNEFMHPSIKYRMEQLGADYKPAPLAGFSRQPQAEAGRTVRFEWIGGKGVRLPEYQIGLDSYERACVATPSASAFLGRVDRELGVDSWEARGLDASPPVSVAPAEVVGFNPDNAFGAAKPVAEVVVSEVVMTDVQ